MVIRLAVRFPVALEEVPRAQLLGAMGAGEVLRMPGLSQGGDYLAHDGFLAGAAAALLAGIDSLATHVGLEVTKHGIQVLFGRRSRLRLSSLCGPSVRRICHCVVLRAARIHLEQAEKQLKSSAKSEKCLFPNPAPLEMSGGKLRMSETRGLELGTAPTLSPPRLARESRFSDENSGF